MFHYDGKHETYARFFLAIREAIGCEVSCAEMTDAVNLVLGSDEERAIVAAFQSVFPAASHIFCVRHMEENVRRYLTDNAGVPVTERNEVYINCLSHWLQFAYWLQVIQYSLEYFIICYLKFSGAIFCKFHLEPH